VKYFFDSSAIIELANQNQNYLRFSDEIIFTTALNIGEVYFYFLRVHNKQTADFWIKHLNFELLEIAKDTAIDSATFKFDNKDKDFSYTDCIGYVCASKNNLKFLTADKWFSNLNNAEIVS